MIQKIITSGIMWKKQRRLEEENIVQEKPARIFNKQWPDIMFAKSRSDKLTTRKEYDTTSIKTSSGDIINGAPGGKKRENNAKPCNEKPIKLIAKKKERAKVKVTTIWLVVVKAYGIIPIKLHKSMNKNKESRAGKYKLLPLLMFSRTILFNTKR